MEIDNLKALLQSKEQELKSEKAKVNIEGNFNFHTNFFNNQSLKIFPFHFQVEELTDTYNKDNNDYEKEFVDLADAAFGLNDENKELKATIYDLKLNIQKVESILTRKTNLEVQVVANKNIVCPVCFESLKAKKIFQCSQGHYICEFCLEKIRLENNECPSCRENWANEPNLPVRNRLAEEMIQTQIIVFS